MRYGMTSVLYQDILLSKLTTNVPLEETFNLTPKGGENSDGHYYLQPALIVNICRYAVTQLILIKHFLICGHQCAVVYSCMEKGII